METKAFSHVLAQGVVPTHSVRGLASVFADAKMLRFGKDAGVTRNLRYGRVTVSLRTAPLTKVILPVWLASLPLRAAFGKDTGLAFTEVAEGRVTRANTTLAYLFKQKN
ncbi:MAG: hypothetical protein CTY18_07105 [Methylomonas sp.]|nr:MAG: hypothetical protein CTY18_07105 [Methylomonas sp.]